MGVFGNDPINAEETGVDGVRELLRHPLNPQPSFTKGGPEAGLFQEGIKEG